MSEEENKRFTMLERKLRKIERYWAAFGMVCVIIGALFSAGVWWKGYDDNIAKKPDLLKLATKAGIDSIHVEIGALAAASKGNTKRNDTLYRRVKSEADSTKNEVARLKKSRLFRYYTETRDADGHITLHPYANK